jgi:NitT/TauT family transport system permease protein
VSLAEGAQPQSSGLRSGLTSPIVQFGPAIVVFAVAVAAFEWGTSAFGIESFILPAPSEIARALVDNADIMIPSAQETLFEALGGLLIGVTAGVIASFVTSRWRTVGEIVLPFGIAASAVPIIAFAPVMNNWFGVLSPLSKMMIVAVMVFFPVLTNVTQGLRDVDESALELMRSYAASEWTILRRLRVPHALPSFFVALKIAKTQSHIGAIVGEYFGGTDLVLARRITQGSSSLRFDQVWAAIAIAAAFGIIMYLIVSGIARLVIPWHASQRPTNA